MMNEQAKENRTLRLLCIFLVSVLMIGLFSGCKKEDPGKDGEPTGTEPTEETTGADTLDPQLEAEDFGGYFTFFGREVDGYSYPYYELNGNSTETVLDSGIFKRNMALQQKYDIQLLYKYERQNNMLSRMSTDFFAGTAHEYDAVLAPTSIAFQMAINGLLYDMADIPYLDFSKPYYDQTLLQDTSIAGIRYFVHGHFSIGTYISSSAQYMNQKLRIAYELPDPYELVRNKTWTWEKMLEMCKATTVIPNDGATDQGQYQYGLAIGIYAWEPLYFSAGVSLVTKDANDIPQLKMGEHLTLIQEINKLMNDHETTFFSSSIYMQALQGAYAVFGEGRALSMIDPLYSIPQYMMNSDFDYAILPVPLHSSEQDTYYAQTHPLHSSVLCLSRAYETEDLPKAGKILEDFAYLSSIYVHSALMDEILMFRQAQCPENYEMLKLIFSNVRCDIGLALNHEVRIDGDVRTLIKSNSTDIFSTLQGKLEAYNAGIANVTAAFQKFASKTAHA